MVPAESCDDVTEPPFLQIKAITGEPFMRSSREDANTGCRASTSLKLCTGTGSSKLLGCQIASVTAAQAILVCLHC